MTNTHRFFLCGCLCISLASLSGCSSFQSLLSDTFEFDSVSKELLAEEPTPEEQPYLDSTDPEKQLDQELAELARLGPWEAQQQTLMTEEKTDKAPVFPLTYNKQVQFYLDQFQGRQRKHYKRWLERSTRFKPFIETELEKAGLPKELVYLAMIESGFNPSAYSRAHAVGLWQFIRGTGRNYGLRIDTWIDERRDPALATRAAIEYLSFLYDEFDDWYLAVAAYNAGEGKIARGIKRYKTRDFWQLAQHNYLSLETKRYVPKLIAAIMISQKPEQFGFSDVQYRQPVTFDLINVPSGTDLNAVAVAAKTDIKTLRRLNNALRRNMTPPGGHTYSLRIPSGSQAMAARNLKRLHPVVTTAYKTHTVKRGDTLSKICRTHHINKTTLLKANNIRTALLKRGQRIRIPYRTTKYILLKEGETPASHFASNSKDGKMILHRLKKGETLSRIARQYNVPAQSIIQWNDIADVRKIKAGEHIALYLGPSSLPHRQEDGLIAANHKTAQIKVLKEQKKTAPVQEAELTAEPSKEWYLVKNGDSLWEIARKFQVSPGQLRQWNNLPSNLIHPGSKLVVKNG